MPITYTSFVGVETMLHHEVSHTLQEVGKVRQEVEVSLFVSWVDNLACHRCRGATDAEGVPHGTVPGRSIRADVVDTKTHFLT